MGTIETTIDMAKDLTLARADGRMVAEDFHEWTAHYSAGATTRFILWDITQADISTLSADDVLNDTSQTKKIADCRKGGKTAIVSGGDLGFGISRMLEIFYEMHHVPIEIRVFRNTEEACEWLAI